MKPSKVDYSNLDRNGLLRMLKYRDHQFALSKTMWIKAAEAALDGRPLELRNRVDLAKTADFEIVQS